MRGLVARCTAGAAAARAIARRAGPPPAPPGPREAAATRGFEAALALAVAASALALALEAAGRPEPPAPGTPPWRALEVDVAKDGPGRLRLLPGFGPARVAAVLEDRARHGPVATVEALDRVRGLGARTVEAARRAGAVVRR